MFDEMGERDFVDFLAAFWESRGWDTATAERDEGVYMITGDKSDGQRGLMLVVPDPEATVSGQMTQKLVTLTQEKGIDMAVAATRGTFSDDSRGIADASGVHLLDVPTLEETVAAEDAHDLVSEFASGGGGDGGSVLDRLPAVGVSLPAGVGGGVKYLVLAVVAVALVVGGIQFLGMGSMLGGAVAGIPLPDLGVVGGEGGGYTMTAVSLSEGNGTTVSVAWDARAQSTVVAPNGESFAAPEGTQFVVVQMNVTNPSNETLVFRARHLALAAGDTRYGNQPLQGASGQLPLMIEGEQTKQGYLVFTVPEDATAATLLGLPGPDVPPMQFERDSTLEFQVGGE